MPGKNVKTKGPEPGRGWNLEDIQELLDLLAGKEITEFEIEQQGVKIRVLRGVVQCANPGNANGSGVVMAAPPVVAPPAAPMPAAAPGPAAPLAPTGTETSAESTEGLFVMKSPIVGTFYSAPSPNAPSFVSVGDNVQVGQVVCIIEAMKLMNELEAEMAGRIARVYVENGQPVEYGQSLFAIEPARKK